MSYNEKIYKRAFDELNLRREKATVKATHKKDELIIGVPRLKEIENELSHAGIELARVVLSGGTTRENILKLKEKNEALQHEKSEILNILQLPKEFLEPDYVCKKCNDNGYIENNMCDCLKSLLKKLAVQDINKTSPLELCSFSSFKLDFYPDDIKISNNQTPKEIMKNVLDYCKKYSKNFSEKSSNILMMGNTGLGKTHLSLAIAKSAVEKGYSVLYDSMPNLLNRIEQEHFNNKSQSHDILNAVLDADLLILDDLGAEFLTQFTATCIYNVINTRLLSRKPTIISTNLTTTEIETRYTNRILSRLIGTYEILSFCGNDIRIKLKH